MNSSNVTYCKIYFTKCKNKHDRWDEKLRHVFMQKFKS